MLFRSDEINRAAPKVQGALLEAMQERKVTIAGESFTLPAPFLVMATQNPVEQSGTFELPEAQLDRFMLLHRQIRRRHTSELQSRRNLVCRLLLEKKKKHKLYIQAATALTN